MEEKVLRDEAGGPFIVQMLFSRPVSMPDSAIIESALTAHLGEVRCSTCGKDLAGYFPCRYQKKKYAPRVFLLGCDPFDSGEVNDFLKSQMWDAGDARDQIFRDAHYIVTAMDLAAEKLPPRQRAALTMDFTEALSDMFPDCIAFYFQNCGKLLPASALRESRAAGLSRYIRFAVNARYFNIDGEAEMIVDTVGLSTLGLPDLQYNFHSMDPNWVVNHAYNMAGYLLEGKHSIHDGDRVDGIEDGNIRPDIRWLCHYEVALIQPVRTVLDIAPGQYAGPLHKE